MVEGRISSGKGLVLEEMRQEQTEQQWDMALWKSRVSWDPLSWSNSDLLFHCGMQFVTGQSRGLRKVQQRHESASSGEEGWRNGRGVEPFI